MLGNTNRTTFIVTPSQDGKGLTKGNSIVKIACFALHHQWTKTALMIACMLVSAPICQAQTAPQTTRQTAPQSRSGQNYQPRLTPQQQAAQARAAQQKTNQQGFVQPPGFPLNAEHTKYVEQLLDLWERTSRDVKKYKCKFQRYEYDTGIVGYRDPQTNVLAAHSRAYGEIRFAAPDRARFETTSILDFKARPQKPGEQPTYVQRPNGNNDVLERWVCDGKTIYNFDFEQKRLYENAIPKDLQGDLANSPLPFVFGANKKQILERYWVRSITPTNAKDEYWLEITPKRIEDARNYKRIEIILAKQDFLPKAMHLYLPQYDPSNGNYDSRYFLFEDRQANGQLDKITDWLGNFIKPRLPLFGGWKTVKGQMGQEQAAVPPSLRPTTGQPTPRRQ